MSITVKSIIQRIVKTLNDETSVRWTIPELVRYLNDGQRDIVEHRPDALNIRVSMPLVAGPKQKLPADGTKLIAVNNNTNGTKGGVTLISREILNAQTRGWRSLAGSSEIYHYMYDPREPTFFEVYPPATTGASLDIEYSSIPSEIAEPAEGTIWSDVVGTFAMSELFSNAIQNYILYRCYVKDTEYTANPQRAAAFYGAYANDLGVELKGTVEVAPTITKGTMPATQTSQ